MSEDEREDAEASPAVELGGAADIEGAPLARVAARLTWPQERSRIVGKEGDTTIRTPEGPKTLGAVLERTETTYFDSRRTFVDAVEDVVGRGPVRTE